MSQAERRPGIRPRASLGRNLDVAARIGFPTGVTVLLMLLTQTPVAFTGQAALLPAVAFGCVWFWSLFRPANLPPPVVFLIGLMLDLLGYLPIGVGVFTLLGVEAVALTWRRALSRQGLLRMSLSRQRFLRIWIVFGLVAAAASLVMWLLVMLLTFRLLSPASAGFTAILATAIFPALAVPFAAALRSFADPEQA